MGEQAEDAPGFEYARLCELESDVADLRETVHTIYTLFRWYRKSEMDAKAAHATAPADKAQGTTGAPPPQGGAPQAGAAPPQPQSSAAAPGTSALAPGAAAAASNAAAAAGSGGAAKRSQRQFMADFQNICHMVYTSLCKFNRTQGTLPPVGAPGQSYLTLADAVPDVQGIGACRMTAEEEARLQAALQQRHTRAQYWAARAEHFDRSARTFETCDFASTGVPSLVTLAGAAAEAERRQRARGTAGARAQQSATAAAATAAAAAAAAAAASATGAAATAVTGAGCVGRPLYDSAVQASLRRQVAEAQERIAARAQRDVAPQSADTLPRIAVYTESTAVPSTSTGEAEGRCFERPPPPELPELPQDAHVYESHQGAGGGARRDRGEPVDVVCGVRVCIPDVLCAVVPLGAGGTVAGVSVLGSDEEHFVPRAGGQTHVESNYLVFREVAAFASVAAHYFEERNSGSALADFLVWLASYENLFSEPCTRCGTMLVQHLNMPPICRDFRTCQPYHSTCLASLSTVRTAQTQRDSKLEAQKPAPRQ